LNKKLKKVSKLFSYLETVIPKIEWTAHSLETMEPIHKNLLKLHGTDLTVSTDPSVCKFYVDNEIHVLDNKKDLIRPYYSLADTIFPSGLQNELKKKGFFVPTPTQSLSWPILLSGQNYLAISKLGNERTLSYCLPALLHANYKLENKQSGEDKLGPSVLVVTSNKSRAIQIQSVFTDFASVMNLKSCFVYGDKFQNAETEPTLESLKEDPAVLIAVLGRNIMNLLGNDKTNLKNCTFLVLDDIDRILSVKNERFLDKLLNQIRPDRQTVIWTSVDPCESKEIRKCIDKIGFTDFVQLHFGTFTHFTKPDCVKQIIDVVAEEGDKEEKLRQLVPTILSAAIRTKPPKLLIFVDSLKKARKVGALLYGMGLTSRCIKEKPATGEPNGTPVETADIPNEDDEVDEDPNGSWYFENSSSHIAIATDFVAYDDLDLESANFIVNYDFPFNRFECYEDRIEKYKIRNNCGTVFTFFNQENNLTTAKKLVDFLIASDQYVNPKIVMPLKDKRTAVNQAKVNDNAAKQVAKAQQSGNVASGSNSSPKPATPNKGNGPRYRINNQRPMNPHHRNFGYGGYGMGNGFNNGFNHPLFNNGFGNGYAGQNFGNHFGGWNSGSEFHRNRPRKFF
jgi:ATP-dependent RNA helicase DDX5/DBP2